MDLWFQEKQTPHLSMGCRVKKILEHKITTYQEVSLLDTNAFGRMLVLDGYIQTTEKDEYIYHEMIVHVPLMTHSEPANVLIIGGGDGGAAREVLKHSSVEKVTMVEIDEEVVEICKSYFPATANALKDSRMELIYTDGREYLRNKEDEFDIIIVDSTEPVGPSAGLFAPEFYQSAYTSLKAEGILVAQTESPFYNQDIITNSYTSLSELFPVTEVYLAPVPSYPGGLWSFMMGSKKYQPYNYDLLQKEWQVEGCRYYSPQVHWSSFILPPFITELLQNGK